MPSPIYLMNMGLALKINFNRHFLLKVFADPILAHTTE